MDLRLVLRAVSQLPPDHVQGVNDLRSHVFRTCLAAEPYVAEKFPGQSQSSVGIRVSVESVEEFSVPDTEVLGALLKYCGGEDTEAQVQGDKIAKGKSERRLVWTNIL